MKALFIAMLGLGVMLGLTAPTKAQAVPTGKYVTVWLLEVKFREGAAWSVVGKYTSLASAQESYFVRARHGGYAEMRIRQTVEWQSNLAARIKRQGPFFQPSKIRPK